MEKDINKEQKDFCLALYILYAVSIISQFFYATLLPGLALITVTYFFNIYKMRAKMIEGTLFQNHLRWMFRTINILMGVLLPVATIVATILIIKMTNVMSLGENMMANGEGEIMLDVINDYLHHTTKTVYTVGVATFAPIIIWTFRRYYIGFKGLIENKPIEKVTSWL